MAIYHLHAQVIGRKSGRSAVAAAAYRAGERLIDERAEKVHDYSRKGGVVYSEIIAPDYAPSFLRDRQQLWNAVEAAEKRKDAQLAREIDIALPRELDRAEQIHLVREFVRSEFVERGMIADVAVHDTDGTNPHAHIMLTMREIAPDGFGKKVRAWNDKKLLEEWREKWADYANRALREAGVDQQIDHRTLAAQGIEREQQIHLGVASHHAHQRGHDTPRYQRFEEIRQRNERRVQLESEAEYAARMAERLSALFAPSDAAEAAKTPAPDPTPSPAPDPRLERLEQAQARLEELREQQKAEWQRARELSASADRLRREAYEHEQRAEALEWAAEALEQAQAAWREAQAAAGGWWHRVLEAVGFKTAAVQRREAAGERLVEAYKGLVEELGHVPERGRGSKASAAIKAAKAEAEAERSDASSLHFDAARLGRDAKQHSSQGEALQREIDATRREISALKRELGMEPQRQQRDRGWEMEL